MKGSDDMDETRFRLVAQEVKVLKGPCAAVMGVVEGSSISVDDYMCRSTSGGRAVTARVEGIMGRRPAWSFAPPSRGKPCG